MSLKPQAMCPVPRETVRVARAAYPKGNLYMQIRDVSQGDRVSCQLIAFSESKDGWCALLQDLWTHGVEKTDLQVIFQALSQCACHVIEEIITNILPVRKPADRWNKGEL